MLISKFKHWALNYRVHLLIWAFYIAYENLFVFIVFGVSASMYVHMPHYVITMFLFYALGNFLFPKLIEKPNKILIGALIFFGYLISYLFLHFFVDVLLQTFGIIAKTTNYGFGKPYILGNLYRGIYFFGCAIGYSSLENYLSERKKTEELEREKLVAIINRQKTEQDLVLAQNAFLKAQINPHFLFNTLDFLYHSVNAHSSSAAEVVVRLAQMMRHAINTEAMGDFINLADEIEHAENLIYLYQARKDEVLNLQFNYESQVLKLHLIPLVLLTLMENIFKHGDLSNPNQKAIVNVGINYDYFFIETSNLIDYENNVVSNSYGLQNIKKRLLYTYGDDIRFDYGSDQNNLFKVELAIPLNRLKGPSGFATSSTDNDK